MQHFLPFWYKICKDRVVLNMLKGIKVPFIDNTPPIQTTLQRELKMSIEEQTFVDQELSDILTQGFIWKLDSMILNVWVSNIFLVPKKNWGFRMILNLKELNKHVVYTKFKMDGIEKVVQMLCPMDFCSSLDISRAYCHLYIFLDHQKYFQFTWKGQFYCYCTLPQGFSDSPQIFVKCTAPIVAALHKLLVNILIYIDDTFLPAPSFKQMEKN